MDVDRPIKPVSFALTRERNLCLRYPFLKTKDFENAEG